MELKDLILELIEYSKNKKIKIKKGINEVLKSIERLESKLIVLANDVDPKKLIEVIPKLCVERKIKFIENFAGKKILGNYIGIKNQTSCVSFLTMGDPELEKKIISKLNDSS